MQQTLLSSFTHNRLRHYAYGYYITLTVCIMALGGAIAMFPIRLTGIALAAGVFGILILLYPRIGLYLLIPAIPFGSVFQVSVGGANIGPMELLLAGMVTAWLLKMIVRQRIVIPHPVFLWPFLIFLGIIGVSWLVTLSLKASLVETVKWIEMLLLYIFMAANLSAEDRKPLLMIMLLTGLAQAGLGLYQFVFKAGPPGFLLFGGRFLRAFGTFRQPNPYAGYLGLLLPLALAMTLWGLGNLKKIVADRNSLLFFTIASGSLAAMLAALFASQSRGAWLAFLAAAIITVLLMGGRWAIMLSITMIIMTTLIAMGILSLLPSTITERFIDALPFLKDIDIARTQLTDANFAILERLAHWQAGQHMWRDNLWLGVGFGNYEAVYPAYAIGRWIDPLGHAHNYILNIGAETGLLGLTGYLIFWTWVILYAVRILRRTRYPSMDKAIIAGSIGVFSHLHVHNLLDNLYVQGMYLHITLVLGLITMVARNQELDTD